MARRGVGVRELIELSEGAFTLPDEVVDAYDAFVRVQQTPIDEVRVLHVDDAAGQLVAAVERGESPDVLALARGVQASTTDQHGRDIGTQILALAREDAAAKAEMIVTDMADRIITQHLAPAFEALMQEAREIAPRLQNSPFLEGDRIDLNAMARDDKPTRDSRQAWRQLEPLAAQRAAIVKARDRVNTISHRTPEKDVQGRFALLKHPERLQPADWKPSSSWQHPLPSEEARAQPVLALRWWAVDAAPGEPWLPTTQQQDQRWEEVFGEWERQRKANAAAGQWGNVIANS